MTFPVAVKTCFMKYANFQGRAVRSEFWWFQLVCLIAQCIPYLGWLLSLGLIVPSLAVGFRRMHDINRQGWWIFVPIYSLVLLAQAGDEGPNRFGEAPENV